jgi:hypothetical protein
VPPYFWIVFGFVLWVVVIAGFTPSFLRSRQARKQEKFKSDFLLKREHLEAQYEQHACEQFEKKGFRWFGDFGDDVVFAKELASGHLRALASITIHFEAIEGGGREEYEAAGTLRAATALFLHDGQQWGSEGRTIMNLSPRQAIDHFEELEFVE